MAKSNKPIFWSLFAAGGTLLAFVLPVVVYLTLMAAYGDVPAGLSYDQMHAFAAHWLGKLILFGVIFLSLWHGAHKLRIALFDFGVRADGLVAIVGYGIAALGTILCIVFLAGI
ncbi:MAG: fumarate reductase subunit D [Gammaproteobacteria bacterium]|nr:fumarate reductase subunit D [Gammaproteobacteria bacterium]